MIPILILILTALGIALAAYLRARAYERKGEGVTVIGPHVGLRLVGGVAVPERIRECAAAIDAVLSARYGGWWQRVDLVIEWHPFGSVITGPYVRTGYQHRGSGLACGAPTPPITDETAKACARVVGTIRIDKLWPWTRRERFTVVVMDGRVGAGTREVLAGDDSAMRSRTPAERTALLYEIAWRVVPLGVEGLLASGIGPRADTWREIERAMRAHVEARTMNGG